MANQRWKFEDWNNIYSALQGTIPPIGSNFYLGQNTHISLSITLCFKSCSVVYPFELGSTIIEVIEQQFLQWDVILRNLSLTWNRVKHMENNHRHELQFAVKWFSFGQTTTISTIFLGPTPYCNLNHHHHGHFSRRGQTRVNCLQTHSSHFQDSSSISCFNPPTISSRFATLLD